jgi:HK97 family phage prohead protease
MQSRAYSFITIKSIDEAERIIEGIASTPTPDRMGDIVNPLGAQFSLPLPLLWQHDHSSPIGHVIDAKATKDGISFRAQLAQTMEPGALKDLLDFAWQSIKMKLVAAVSIGFRPLKYAFLSDGGIEFDEWEWYELSAVTIPAQADATITSIKSIDAGLRRAAGVAEPEIPLAPKAAASGKALPVVKLDAPVRVRAEPFVIRKIRTN